jgi:hypothetical protein
MIIGNEPSKWNADAATLLRQFLNSKIGKVFLQQMGWKRPSFYQGLSLEETALQAKFVAGYEGAIANLLDLAQPPESDEKISIEQYPDIDDDSKWPEQPRQEEASAPVAAPEKIVATGKAKSDKKVK